MRPYTEGESLLNLIKSAIPDFVDTDYPLFMEFVGAYMRFMEERRAFTDAAALPEYGVVANSMVQVTETLGGSFYEARKLLDYRDAATTLDEFRAHFLSMFAKDFPSYSYVPLDTLVRSLREFYQNKGTVESIQWFFRVLFNEHAEVYFPRTDVLRASDGTWSAPLTLKVSAPIDDHTNADVATFYVGQRVQTPTGSAQVESVLPYIVGQAFNQNIIVNELNLKFSTVLGTFAPGQTLMNIDSAEQVQTTILPVIASVIINTGGSNYQAGDLVTFSEGPGGGYGYGAYGSVSQTSNSAISGVIVDDGGDGYITGLDCVFTSTSGHGADATVQEVTYGHFLLEDDSGAFALEQQTTDARDVFQMEDVNVLFLELVIDHFCNASAVVPLLSADYGTDASVPALNGVVFDSKIEIALAAVDTKPFMHPWVFTNPGETTAVLANAECILSLTGNVAFSNSATVYSLTGSTDLVSNSSTANVSANVIVSAVQQGGSVDNLFLKDFRGLNKLQNGLIVKQVASVSQTGTITTDGSANCVGSGTSFTTVLTPATHIQIGSTNVVVHAVVNNTFFIAETPVTALVANTYAVFPTGTITSIIPQQQRYYGKIKTVRLLNNGTNYRTTPAVTSDSVSARAQQLFYLDPGADLIPGTSDDSIVAAGSQIRVFTAAQLRAQQDAGQISRVTILGSGVNYTDPSAVAISAIHAAPRTGTDAVLTPVLGALTQYPGQFTTSRSFLSDTKALPDADFYNDYTYVVRVGESFDRYRDILLQLVHPAGFKAYGQFVSEDTFPNTIPNGTVEIKLPGLLPLDLLIGPYLNTQVQNFPADYGGDI